ncbi:hypothetical protein BAE44_0017135 [Dichanthelium oligosanthes]|uniref:Uncharacterized protein n=1 Tax=Dichanthelium oligosanthes TaxID=888268 RepID=A0A1E5V9L9_9POAL|nr:hypothetical protein BAE44_0017135 [Dichanthelium oligosanthes]
MKVSDEWRQDFRRKIELKEKVVQQVDREYALRERDMDYKIMMTNTNSLNPAQRQYIMMQQMEILRKFGINDKPS